MRKTVFSVSAGKAPPSSSKTAANLSKIVSLTGGLPPMPHIAAQVMEKLSDPNSTPREIHRLLTKDQSLAARVLKVANSPYYGASRSISTLKDAILFMGFDSVRSLIITAVMKGIFSETSLAQKLLWEHSIGCGVAARQISIEIGLPGREEAFLAGLLHDLGKAVLFIRVPDIMRQIMQEVYHEGSNFATVENRVLGFTHAEVGQLVADLWHFTIGIEDAIANHHQPGMSELPASLSHTVSLANSMCHKLEVGPTRKADLDLMEIESAKELGLKPAAMEQILRLIQDVVSQAAESGF